MPQHTTLKHKSKVCFLAETTQPDEIKIQHQEKGYFMRKKGKQKSHTNDRSEFVKNKETGQRNSHRIANNLLGTYKYITSYEHLLTYIHSTYVNTNTDRNKYK